MRRAGGQRHLLNKVFQTRGREQAAQRGGAHRRPLVTPLFSSSLTGLPSRMALSAILEVGPNTFLLNASNDSPSAEYVCR
jgi:hypothetical protein